MKMSEFTTKSFLGNAGAAENSYILINYEDNTTQRPVTYKASLQEIGKAIANDQKLYKKTQNGAVTTDVSQGAYINGTAEVFASTGAVAAAVSGLASTGYVDTAVANADSGFDPTAAVTCEVYPDPDDSDPQSWSLYPVMAAPSTDEIFTYDRGEKGYFPRALASTGYVDAAVANAGGNDGFTNDGDIPVYVGASDGDLKWYNWANSADCTPYNVISTNGKYLVAYDENENTFGYFADVSDAQMTPLSLGGQTDLHGYIQAASSLPGQYRLQFWEEGGQSPVEVTPSMVGAPSAGALTAAVSGLASTGYVTSAISTATSGLATTNALAAKADASTVNALSLAVSTKMNASQVNEAISDAITDLASAGYVTSAINTAAMDKVFVSQGQLCYYNSEGSIDFVNTDLISGAAPSTMEYNGTTLSYLLIDGSTDTYYKDDNGAWGNLGAVPVFYNANNDRLVDIAGNSINLENNPYTVEVSEWTLNYMTFDNGGGQAIISDDGNHYEDLGHPLFFNETENEIGYYKLENGERVWQAVSSLT